jgi:hypothetical protein
MTLAQVRKGFGRFSARRVSCAALVLFGLTLPPAGAGCSSAVESGHNTALDRVDLVQMTNQMAASLAADRKVQDAIATEGALKIVIEPVDNKMTGEVLPAGQALGFVARVRALLSEHAPDRFTWVINRDDFDKLRARELDRVGTGIGPDPEAINPHYALWAHFHSITNETSKGRSSSYLCVYELTDLERRTTLWTDKYEVKKVAVKAFLD